MLDIICKDSPFMQSHMYICCDNMKAIVIDPFPYFDLNKEYKGVAIDYIFLTHEHYDHISGVNYFRENTDCKVICSMECNNRIQDAKTNLSTYFDVLTAISGFAEHMNNNLSVDPYTCKADIIFSNEMVFSWQGHTCLLFETPGHTSGCACLLVDEKFLFSGDTLFFDMDTITRFPSGNKKLFQTITTNRLKQLPGNIKVYPGHYQSFILQDKSLIN